MKKILLITAAAVLALVIYSCTLTGPAGPSGANAVTAEFQYGVLPGDGYTQSYDAGIDDDLANYSSGGDPEAWVGYNGNKWRELIRFDLSSIAPVSVTVTSAYLRIYISSLEGTTSTLTAYPMKRSWVEGDEIYGDTADTYVSWMYYNGVGNAWASGKEGGDFDTVAVSDSVLVSSAPQFVDLVLNTTTVQSWITDPAANYGVILRESFESGADHHVVVVTNEETANPALRPKLVVNYKL